MRWSEKSALPTHTGKTVRDDSSVAEEAARGRRERNEWGARSTPTPSVVRGTSQGCLRQRVGENDDGEEGGGGGGCLRSASGIPWLVKGDARDDRVGRKMIKTRLVVGNEPYFSRRRRRGL